jgi:hypothetical protein
MVNVHSSLRNHIHNSVPNLREVPKSAKREAAAVTTPGGGAPAPATPITNDPAADFRALFSSKANPPDPKIATPAKAPCPTTESMFGPNPWIANPGGTAPNGVTYGYNPQLFATKATADKLAQIYGGKVVEMNAITPFGPFQQTHLNQMIQFPNGNLINAGMLASCYSHGLPQEQVDRDIAAEINTIFN